MTTKKAIVNYVGDVSWIRTYRFSAICDLPQVVVQGQHVTCTLE